MKLFRLNPIYILALFLLFQSSCAHSQQVFHNSPKSSKVRDLFQEALGHYNINDYAAALNSIDQCLKKDPWFIEAWDLKGQILLADEQYRAASDLYLELTKKDAGFKFAWLELTKVSFLLKDYDACLQYAQIAKSKFGPSDQKELSELEQTRRNAQFAREASKHPVPFNPVSLGPGVNTKLEEYHPGLTVDGKSLFFTRRDGKASMYEQNEDIFISERRQGTFESARNMGGPVNTPENEGAFSTSADGQYLFFTSCNRPGGLGSCDIWLAMLKGDEWKGPFNLGKPLNSSAWDAQPALSSDGNTLYFVSSRPGGSGGSDIWKSTFSGNSGWSEPVNLGPEINTPWDEQFPYIHPDGKTLYFSSAGHPGMGKSDFFVSRLKENGEWESPRNLGYPINSSEDEWNLIVDRTGDTAYFASNGIAGGAGRMDLYWFLLPEYAQPEKVSYVKGLIVDDETGAPVQAAIELIRLKDGQSLIKSNNNSKSGQFLVTLQSGHVYGLNAQAKGYLFHSEHFDLMQHHSIDEPKFLNVRLKKIKTGNTLVLNNIFFDTDKSILKKESESELQILLQLMQNNPGMSIEIGGHTDNQGTEARNKVLSTERATAVQNYLLERGISKERMVAKGYGSSIPVADNNSEEGRSRNRRTEIKVTGI